MKMIKRVLTLCLLVIISLVGIIGCNSIDKVENEFDLDTFKEEMKSRGYDFEIENIVNLEGKEVEYLTGIKVNKVNVFVDGLKGE